MAQVLRQNTLKFTFDERYARPRAYEVERFLRETVKLNVDDVVGIQLSIVSSAVYVKLINSDSCEQILATSGGQYKFNHCDGNVGDVKVSHAGLGVRTVRIFELPLEIPVDQISAAFGAYGRVISVAAEKWNTFETFRVLNGVRQLKIDLRKHVPSYINICGHRAIVMYDGQPRTCSGCGQTGHVRSECVQRRVTQLPPRDPVPPMQMTALPVMYTAAARADALRESPVEIRGDGGMEDAARQDLPATESSAPSSVEMAAPQPAASVSSPDCDTVPHAALPSGPTGRPDVAVDPVLTSAQSSEPENDSLTGSAPKSSKKRRIAPPDAAARTQQVREKAQQIARILHPCTQSEEERPQLPSASQHSENSGAFVDLTDVEMRPQDGVASILPQLPISQDRTLPCSRDAQDGSSFADPRAVRWADVAANADIANALPSIGPANFDMIDDDAEMQLRTCLPSDTGGS